MRKKPPMQPVVWDGSGVLRFQKNEIIKYLLEVGKLTINDLAKIPNFKQSDWDQFYQLIGYSISGYGELNLVSDESYQEACRKRDQLFSKYPEDPAGICTDTAEDL